jgi:nitroimidazol reductase NimA-like FMN-containing flavoprotein (pyridoxamine 5'-phosphate oxidase superfamily)
MTEQDHKRRVKKELLSAGLTRYSLTKNETRRLPQVIHDDEHIGAAINGRSATGAVMLVATDKRLLFLDCKSFYSSIDEISYDVVSGVMHHTQGLFSNIIVHTRVGEYNLRFVNNKQANKFVNYLESKQLEQSNSVRNKEAPDSFDASWQPLAKPYELDNPARSFLQTNTIGVLSTIDRTGNVCGATVYYLCDPDDQLYILTKSETSKARNMLQHPQVALTIFDEYSIQSLQVSGLASVVTDVAVTNQVFSLLTKERQYKDNKSTTPVTKIQEGSFVVFRISITDASYRKFKS